MLTLRSFGYRSVHLIAYVDATRVQTLPQGEGHAGLKFEIQVRSLLEHAWAEIEHEVVYKSGIEHSKQVLRMFAALAGTLELLDSEFETLRQGRNGLVDVLCERYRSGLDGRRRLDAARLVALLEVYAPDALGWRSPGVMFPARSDAVCAEALRWVGIRSADKLRQVVATAAFRRLLGRFAADNGIAPTHVSHLALTVLAVAVLDRRVLGVVFPEMIRDPSLSSWLAEADTP